MAALKTLIVTSCTGEKKYDPPEQLIQEDFADPTRFLTREKELENCFVTAGEMYTGRQHYMLMQGVTALRNRFGDHVVDVCIVSAGYGVLTETRKIAPYEVTFNTMRSQEVLAWSRFLKIKESLTESIRGYDLVFFLLGDKYLSAIELPIEITEKQTLIFFASGSSRKQIPDAPNCFVYEVGQVDAKSFRCGLISLKGYLFKLLAQEIINQGVETLTEIKQAPQVIDSLLSKYRKVEKTTDYALFSDEEVGSVVRRVTAKPQKEEAILPNLSEIKFAKNFGIPMQFYIPECDDRVDPRYNFMSDEATEGRDPYLNDVYAHEIFEDPNYDGVLISKVNVEESKIKRQKVENVGVHSFIRYPKTQPIMGDCGAFGYIGEHEPPYSTEEILDYYQKLGFDFGVSIDHLIAGDIALDPVERQRRYDITRKNASDFINKWRNGNYSFTPIGVAQGWDPLSYRESVAELVGMGYQYIALGGMARTPTKQIMQVLLEVAPVIPDYLRVHLFGVARLDAIPLFRALGVTSFDSSSHLRRAWLGSGSNYFALDGQTYAAIRIPPVDGHGLRVKKMIAAGKGSKEDFKKLEVQALASLRGFDRGEMSLDDALESVLAYDEKIGDGRERHAEYYRKVLEDQPWKKCDCKICREIGIEVIIFRGNNRNRRRGFHNTYYFYKKFQELL